MGKKLFVGNLPLSATDQSIKEAFSRWNSRVQKLSLIVIQDVAKVLEFVEMS
jgi:hypothetical protein